MIALSEEQKDIIRALITKKGEEQVQTVGGYAGTGKTTLIATLVQKLSNWAVCAYTGKAANVLRRKGIAGAQTIHSTIYQPYDDNGEVYFDLIAPHNFVKDGFIVDEGSMVGKEIYEDLLSFGKPVIFVGDHGQLEPVSGDFNLMQNPMYKLDKVHRNAGEIAHFAEHLRFGRNPWDFKDREKVQIGTVHDIGNDHLLGTDQIICAYNKFRVNTNERIRHALKHKGLIEVGERVMCLKNNKPRGLFNGMQGVVKAFRFNTMDFESDGTLHPYVKYDPEQFGKERTELKPGRDAPLPFDYAYCVTCHKSQGDEWENILVYEQICDKWDHKRWAYTAASRAKHSVIWVAQRR